jgi:hypothetical protein
MPFSILGFKSMKPVWKIHRNSKMGWAHVSAARHTHLRVLPRHVTQVVASAELSHHHK